MKTRAAVLWETGAKWEVEEVDLDPPGPGEVLVRLVACGLCHSDEHFVTGDTPLSGPMIGGHEASGVVEEVGAGVTELAPGDHVVTAFLPACGTCPYCRTGRSHLCDRGISIGDGWQVADGTSRHHARGMDLRLFCMLGAFADRTVGAAASFIKIPADIPLEPACLVACGVTTGWGAAVHRAGVEAGEDVVVLGAGGVGTAAIQGARHAGARRIFVVEPVGWKRERVAAFGATHAYASVADALPAIRELTAGRMCHKAVSAMGVGRGQDLAAMMSLLGKRKRAVVVNVHPWTETAVQLSTLDLLHFEKELVGCLFGSADARVEVPRLLGLYRDRLLDLDGMVTRRYPLESINEAYQDLRDGQLIRGVLAYD